ncbi:hypothetical protein H9P43_005181 [Blastocladiella emersonii ATCC 22665]|nr:hypothetical protein H9P43_005181 [Blastocladiella emersonii ATCC 22665]
MVGEGKSAVLGHPVMFHAVHIAALLSIAASVIGSLGVIAHINRVTLPAPLSQRTGGLFAAWGSAPQKPKRLEFAARFAMYLAVVDAVWSTSHAIDHGLLLFTRVLPSETTGVFLGMVVWVLFGYHQMMHACLSLFTWLRVCREVKLDLGRLDWKLHALCFGSIAATTPIIYFINGFGIGGFWCINNIKTDGGTVLLFMATTVSAINAVATHLCNRIIAERLKEVSDATSARPAAKAPPLTGFLARIIKSRVMDSSAALKRNSFVSNSSATDAAPRRDSSMTGYTTAPSTMPRGGGGRGDVGAGSGDGSGSGHDGSAPGAAGSTGSAGAAPAPPSPSNKKASKGERRSLVASLCLNNLIRTASLVYIPLTFVAVIITATQQLFHVIEPVSAMFCGVFTTATGFINAYAYFQNERLKLSMRSS